MTDWGAHHNDIAQWGNGTEAQRPRHRRRQAAHRNAFPAASLPPASTMSNYTYANGVTHHCQSTTRQQLDGGRQSRPRPASADGVKFEGTDGWIFVTRGKIEASDPELLNNRNCPPAPSLCVVRQQSHAETSSIACGRAKAPICEAEIGHRSFRVCHLGVIAIRLGRKLQWDPAKEQFVNDAELIVLGELRKPWSYDAV